MNAPAGTPSQMYVQAAAKFEEALREMGPLAKEGTSLHGIPPVYFLNIERANCLFLSGASEYIDEAIRIYEYVISIAPKDPTVRLRLARALDKKSRIETSERSVEELNHSVALLRDGERLIADDPLTGNEHWIAISMRVQLGFVYWKLAHAYRRVGAPEEFIGNLARAIRVTRRGYRYWLRVEDKKTRESSSHKTLAHKALSNILYYCGEIARHRGPCSDRHKNWILSTISDFKSIQFSETEYYREYFKTRDNLMSAYEAIGDFDEAAKYAYENFGELRDRAEKMEGRPLMSDEVIAVYSRSTSFSEEGQNFKSARAFLREHRGWA